MARSVAKRRRQNMAEHRSASSHGFHSVLAAHLPGSGSDRRKQTPPCVHRRRLAAERTDMARTWNPFVTVFSV